MARSSPQSMMKLASFLFEAKSITSVRLIYAVLQVHHPKTSRYYLSPHPSCTHYSGGILIGQTTSSAPVSTLTFLTKFCIHRLFFLLHLRRLPTSAELRQRSQESSVYRSDVSMYADMWETMESAMAPASFATDAPSRSRSTASISYSNAVASCAVTTRRISFCLSSRAL